MCGSAIEPAQDPEVEKQHLELLQQLQAGQPYAEHATVVGHVAIQEKATQKRHDFILAGAEDACGDDLVASAGFQS